MQTSWAWVAPNAGRRGEQQIDATAGAIAVGCANPTGKEPVLAASTSSASAQIHRNESEKRGRDEFDVFRRPGSVHGRPCHPLQISAFFAFSPLCLVLGNSLRRICNAAFRAARAGRAGDNKFECRRVAQIHARVPWDAIAENQVTEGSTIERKARTLLSYICSLTAYPMWIEGCFGPRVVTLRWTSTMERLRRCVMAPLPSVAGIPASLIPIALMSMALVGSIFGGFVLSACA